MPVRMPRRPAACDPDSSDNGSHHEVAGEVPSDERPQGPVRCQPDAREGSPFDEVNPGQNHSSQRDEGDDQECHEPQQTDGVLLRIDQVHVLQQHLQAAHRQRDEGDAEEGHENAPRLPSLRGIRRIRNFRGHEADVRERVRYIERTADFRLCARGMEHPQIFMAAF